MSQYKYNGWSNRETWLVNVWFSPETKSDVDYAEDVLNEQYNALPDGVLKDMIDLNSINWDELRDNCSEDEDEDGE